MRCRYLACLFLPALLTAQKPDRSEPRMRANDLAGLQMLDGELWGGADGYKVRFDTDGFEFTPALGASAPRNYPMTFRLESIGRGAARAAFAATTRRHDGLRVEYDRGSVIERYDVGAAALEQSFVFATRPDGPGDLVVRGRLQTDMQVAHERGGLRLEQPGFGGFHLGAVTGVDANGTRVEGSVRYADGVVELSLPAAFVDRAALPFVLDPLIGIRFALNLNNQFDDRGPVAAFDTSNDCYLVIWTSIFSATDTDIHGQRISRAGSLLGTRIFIDTSTARESEPTIANVNGRNTFAVAYNRNGDIIVRGVAASNGLVSLFIFVASGAANQHSPSIGGDPFEPFVNIAGNAVCVWESDAEPAVLATKVVLNTDGTLSLSGTVHTLMAGTTGRASRPRISRSGGGSARYAVVFERQFADKDPWAIVVNANGLPLTPAVALDSSAGDGDQPEVDGNGANWVAAWQQGSSNHDIFVRGLAIAGTPAAIVASPTTQVTAGHPLYDEIRPSVIWSPGSTLIGWDYRALPLFGDTAAIASIDPFHCGSCEGAFFPVVIGADGPPFGCSASSGGGPADDALLVWESVTQASPTNADITAQFWRSADGLVGSLGGSCGPGGLAQATCVRVPNPGFAHRLRGTTPNAGTLLLQSLGQESAPCGPCNRIPALSSMVALFLVADGLGNAEAISPIPNNTALRGLMQFDQWLTLRPGAACSQFGVDMSNTLRIVID